VIGRARGAEILSALRGKGSLGDYRVNNSLVSGRCAESTDSITAILALNDAPEDASYISGVPLFVDEGDWPSHGTRTTLRPGVLPSICGSRLEFWENL